MELHSLSFAKNSIKKEKRIGRGGCRGGTSTRGNNGAKSRSGFKNKPGFEGGQMPLHKRIPKFGFKNINRVEFVGINLYTISRLIKEKRITDTVNFDILVKNSVISKKDKYKILGDGDINFAHPVKFYANSFSKKAIEKIQTQGSEIFIV